MSGFFVLAFASLYSVLEDELEIRKGALVEDVFSKISQHVAFGKVKVPRFVCGGIDYSHIEMLLGSSSFLWRH